MYNRPLTLSTLDLNPIPPIPSSFSDRKDLEAEVEAHYRAHASKASKLGAADVAAEYQSIKAEVATKTAKIASECEGLTAQLQVCTSSCHHVWVICVIG